MRGFVQYATWLERGGSEYIGGKGSAAGQQSSNSRYWNGWTAQPRSPALCKRPFRYQSFPLPVPVYQLNNPTDIVRNDRLTAQKLSRNP